MPRPNQQAINKQPSRERRRATLYFAAFLGFVLLAWSPYGDSVERILIYPGLALILILSLAALYAWLRPRERNSEEAERWWKQIYELLRFPW